MGLLGVSRMNRKRIRSYAMDEDVADFLDDLPDGRGKVISRGTYVNKAVRMYWLRDMGEEIERMERALEANLDVIERLRAEKRSRGILYRLWRLLRRQE